MGWRLLQIALGVIAAGIVILLAAFRVDVCSERWQAAPAALLVVVAFLMIPIIRFAAMRLMLGTCALILTGYAAWILYLGGALAGCE